MSGGPKYGQEAKEELDAMIDALVEHIPAHPEILTASNPFDLASITGLPFDPDMSIAVVAGLIGAARKRHKAATEAPAAALEQLATTHEQKYGGIW